MAITKQFLKTKPECKVTFTLDAEEAHGALSVALVGDFNDWDADAHPMKKQKNGNFRLALTFPADGEIRFRYLVDDWKWLNDPSADGDDFCPFANACNSLVKLSA